MEELDVISEVEEYNSEEEKDEEIDNKQQTKSNKVRTNKAL